VKPNKKRCFLLINTVTEAHPHTVKVTLILKCFAPSQSQMYLLTCHKNSSNRNIPVSVSKRDTWNVHVTGFLDWLVVRAWISDNDYSWLHKRLLDLVSEGARGVPASL
jgi:hypothetical protein